MGSLQKTQIEDLNGFYKVTYQTLEVSEEWFEFSEANVEIINGTMIGTDLGGVIWNANFSLLPDGRSLGFTAVLDASEAPSDVFLHDKMGNMTREQQTYTGVFKINKFGDEVTLSGKVNHGVLNVVVNMTRANDE